MFTGIGNRNPCAVGICNWEFVYLSNYCIGFNYPKQRILAHDQENT